MFDPEIESFKTNINFCGYATSQGYQLDRKESWAGSAVMRNGKGDKIAISRDLDGHHVYYSFRDESDHGTIIDFVQRRLGYSLGKTREELRPWLGMPATALPSLPPLQKIPKDLIQVQCSCARMETARSHGYLENTRAIPRELLESRRFAGRIKIDARYGNAIFPHEDEHGLCGFEIKNKGYTSFAPGGTKGLFTSHLRIEDRALVIAESGVDALSYAALFPSAADTTRYASVGGRMTSKQHELVRSAAAVMLGPAVIVAAVDNDAAGSEMAEIIAECVRLAGRSDLRFERHSPKDAKDWNDVLKSRPPRPLPRSMEELRAG